MGKVKSEYDVEIAFIERLNELSYDYIELNNYEDLLLNFRNKLCEFNSAKLIELKGEAKLSDKEFRRVLLAIDNKTIYESSKILRDKKIIELDNGKSVYLEFFSNDTTRNIYQVTHQVTMDKEHREDVLYKNRYDVTILINGLPLVQIELKRPGIEINEAINQINRYRRFSFKGLFRFIQVFIVSNSTQTKYFANANENNQDGTPQDILKSLVFFWTDDQNIRINKLIDFTNDFLNITNLTDIISKYFIIKESEPVLMVMRPYQIYAVKKAFDRIIVSNMDGYIFHTTGSGKTLTSYKLASLLRDDSRISKVFFLIDRKDLDDQTVDEYNSFESNCVDSTENTKELVNSLNDSTKSLVVTTIQKLAAALRSSKYYEKMEKYKFEKVVFIIDECHRSQFGKMHSDIKKHFEMANYIGFTGTPIFKENKSSDGRTTADIFAAGKLDSCIHKYMIKEAIADGNVLKFSVEYMRSVYIKKVSDNSIDVNKLDDPDYCKRQNIDISELYHDEQRIMNIAEDVLNNLHLHIHPTGKDIYTAIFAIDRIEYLMKYYRYMKNHNPKGYKIAAIFTYEPNQDFEECDKYAGEELKECIDDYNKIFNTDYSLDKFDAYRKDISKRMKQKDLPQVDLLLVVNMFLTGFDSKPTNTLILDKDLIWHSLVQAYSRTNRIYKTTKQYGQIITYRNIKKAQDAALKLYSGDGNPNDYLLQSYEFYLTEFRKWVEKLKETVKSADDAGHLQDEDSIRQFIITFRKLTQVLSTLKTFSKFDWKDLDVFMKEDEYFDYKSWYLYYYDMSKTGGGEHKNNVPADIDFSIELIRTDKINVVYILNLLKEINRENIEEFNKSIDLIMREIDRSDNEKMRYKKELMKSFIKLRFFDLDPDVDIIEAYEQYEKENLKADIEKFSFENSLDEKIINIILTDYFINPKSITKENIRERIEYLHLGLLKSTYLVDSIIEFAVNMYNKYTAEGV